MRPDLEARGFRVFEISTVSHEGLRQLTFALGDIVAQHRAAAGRDARAGAHRHPPPGLRRRTSSIRVEGGTYGDVYRILGEKPVRWVQQTDFQNEEAVGYLADRLEKLGVEDELFRAGAIPGATVVIGEGDGIIFDWQPALSSAAELMTAPRGTDPRLIAEHRDAPRRSAASTTTSCMDAKAEARAELEAERLASDGLGPRRTRRDGAATARDIAAARRVVVKVGSSSISGDNAEKIGPIVEALAAAHAPRHRGRARLVRARSRPGMPFLAAR